MFIYPSLLSHIHGNDFYKTRSKTKFHIKDVLNNYWEDFVDTLSNLNIRDVVFQEVDKVRKCRTIALGYTQFDCPHCDNFVIVPHTCKSRFCSSCGSLYTKKRVINSKSKLLNVKHRHIVFTIPNSLRNIFRKNRSLLNLLYDSVNETITWIFNPSSFHNRESKKPVNQRVKTIKRVLKDSCLVPGYICVLHTYGRDLKWNPHIHMLISEGGLSNVSFKFKKISHFNYQSLRKTFQKILLDKLYNHFGKSFYQTKCKLYKKHNNGFYVYAHPKQFDDIQKGIEYVLRYSSKPAMAESRITNIDFDNDVISYWYDDHTTGKRIEVNEHPFTFLSKLILHIPDKNFKMIRYYGLYASKNHRYQEHINKMFKLETIKTLKQQSYWRYSLISSFNVDPIMCECGHIMVKTYACIPINESEDEWYEIIYNEQKTKFSINWEHHLRYNPTSY